MENRLSTPLFIINSSYRFFKEKFPVLKAEKFWIPFALYSSFSSNGFSHQKKQPEKTCRF